MLGRGRKLPEPLFDFKKHFHNFPISLLFDAFSKIMLNKFISIFFLRFKKNYWPCFSVNYIYIYPSFFDFFSIPLQSRFLIHIYSRISLVNHGLSLDLTVLVLVEIHSLANSRNILVNWLHMSSTSTNGQRRVIQSTLSSFSINICLLTYSQNSHLNEPATLVKNPEASWLLIYNGSFKTSEYI